MDIIPAIDLRRGKCVRLRQGKEESLTEYSEDPLGTALSWEAQGAHRLHVVNLDGAFGRASQNIEIVREMAKRVGASIQFGGGLRSAEDIEKAIAIGCAKIVLGTAAIENPLLVRNAIGRFGADRIIVGVDALGGKVATQGWQSVTSVEVLHLAKEMKEIGAREILYTDISRDGMLTGPDVSTLAKLAALGIDLIASGGIASEEDVFTLAELGEPRIKGVVIGKALYEGRIDLRSLLGRLSSC
jgi:phosphoribosylformimino-5-aminoimidazole carboxamide ribotide isomerase